MYDGNLLAERNRLIDAPWVNDCSIVSEDRRQFAHNYYAYSSGHITHLSKTGEDVVTPLQNDLEIMVMVSPRKGIDLQCSLAWIIASCFVPNPKKYMYVKYLDGNKYNNASSNLVWVRTFIESRSDRTMHRFDYAAPSQCTNQHLATTYSKPDKDMSTAVEIAEGDTEFLEFLDELGMDNIAIIDEIPEFVAVPKPKKPRKRRAKKK